MSEEEKPKLGLRPQLGIKRTTEVSQVKQSFSHGRTKAVVVEKKRTVTVPRPGGAPAAAPAPAPAPEPVKAAAPATPPPAPKPLPPSAQRSGMVLRTLTEEEKIAHAKALGNAKIAEAEARARAEETALLQYTTHGLNRLFKPADPLLSGLRNLGLNLTNRLPVLRNALIRYAIAGRF